MGFGYLDNSVSGTWGLFDVNPVILRNFGADFVELSPPKRPVGSQREWHQSTGNSAIYKEVWNAFASRPAFDHGIENHVELAHA